MSAPAQTADVVPINPLTKRCRKCGVTKPLATEYYVCRRHPNGRATYCKECELKHRRNTYGVHGDTHHRRRQKSISYKCMYGITLDDAAEMLRQQFGLCANRACGKPISLEITKRGPGQYANSAVLDHCHATGKIRGMLCNKCNMLAGVVENNSNNFVGIIEYLARSKKG